MLERILSSPGHRLTLGLTLVAVISAIFVAVGAIPQDVSYHQFADQRTLVGIPNFLNVASNIPFLVVGAFGLGYCLNQQNNLAPYSWATFFLGVVLVSIGSSYYHCVPDNQSLAWDRLPMTISFMGLFIGLLAESIDPNIERKYLAFAVLVGVSSVIYWIFTDDLRFYGLVQFGSLGALMVILFVFRPRYSHSHYLVYGLFGYGLAKITEMYDTEIYQLSSGAVSGHTLKHLLAATSVFWILQMLRIRYPIVVPDVSGKN